MTQDMTEMLAQKGSALNIKVYNNHTVGKLCANTFIVDIIPNKRRLSLSYLLDQNDSFFSIFSLNTNVFF